MYLQLKSYGVIMFLHVFSAYIVCCLGLRQGKLAETD